MANVKKTIITNYVSLMAGDLTAKFLGFLAIVYLARKLGTVDFGKLSFAEAFIAYFLYIGVAGVDTIATREIARDRTLLADYLSNVLLLKVVLGLVAYLFMVVAISVTGLAGELKYLTLLYGLCLLPLALSPEWVFQGVERMAYVGLFRALREACYLVGIAAILVYSNNLYLVPVARVSAMLIAVVILLSVIVYRMNLRFSLHINGALWKSLLRKSYPILISQLFIVLVYSFPIVLLGLLGRTEETGYYSSVQKIIIFFFGVAGVFWSVIFPPLARMHTESKSLLAVFEGHVSKVVAVAVIPIGIIGFFLAKPIIMYIYGSEYVRSVTILRLLIWVAVLGVFNGIFVQGLIISDREKAYARVVGLQAVSLVALCLVLVPSTGGIGASVAWLLVETLAICMCKYLYNKVVRFEFYRYLVKPTLASLVIAFSLRYFDGVNILFVLPMCLVGYVGIMLVIKGIEISELKLVYQSLTVR